VPNIKFIDKPFIILASYRYFVVKIFISKKQYVRYEPNKDFGSLINFLVKNNNRVVVIEYFYYNNRVESIGTGLYNICEEIHKVVEYLNISGYILLS